jgi:hypothetical protein
VDARFPGRPPPRDSEVGGGGGRLRRCRRWHRRRPQSPQGAGGVPRSCDAMADQVGPARFFHATVQTVQESQRTIHKKRRTGIRGRSKATGSLHSRRMSSVHSAAGKTLPQRPTGFRVEPGEARTPKGALRVWAVSGPDFRAVGRIGPRGAAAGRYTTAVSAVATRSDVHPIADPTSPPVCEPCALLAPRGRLAVDPREEPLRSGDTPNAGPGSCF